MNEFDSYNEKNISIQSISHEYFFPPNESRILLYILLIFQHPFATNKVMTKCHTNKNPNLLILQNT
jgi:hypothetical protein